MTPEDLTKRLAATAERAATMASLPPASAVREQGDRRRGRSAMIATAAAVAAVIFGAVVAFGGPWQEPAPYADSPSCDEPSATRSGPPARAVDPDCPSRYTPSKEPSGKEQELCLFGLLQSPPPNEFAGKGRQPRLTTIPDTLPMPCEGAPGWERDDDKDVAGAFNPCGDADTTRVGRTDARTLRGPTDSTLWKNGSSDVTTQLLFFGSDEQARAAMESLLKDADQCWSADKRELPDASIEPNDDRIDLRWFKDGGFEPAPPETAAAPYKGHQEVYVRRWGNAIYIYFADISDVGQMSYGNEMARRMGHHICTQAKIACRAD
jgi:hypothetical protein